MTRCIWLVWRSASCPRSNTLSLTTLCTCVVRRAQFNQTLAKFGAAHHAIEFNGRSVTLGDLDALSNQVRFVAVCACVRSRLSE